MEEAKMILAYLQVLLSWPVITLILGLVFIKLFKESISDFFKRIVKGEAYGVRLEASHPMEQKKETKEAGHPQPDEFEKYIRENPKAVLTEYLRVFNGYRFERACNIIYGTQVDLLEYLSTKGTDGEKYVNLNQFYNEFLKRSNVATTQMADYIGFLKEMQFIEYLESSNDITVRITPLGINFLSYIKVQYPTSYKYKPF